MRRRASRASPTHPKPRRRNLTLDCLFADAAFPHHRRRQPTLTDTRIIDAAFAGRRRVAGCASADRACELG